MPRRYSSMLFALPTPKTFSPLRSPFARTFSASETGDTPFPNTNEYWSRGQGKPLRPWRSIWKRFWDRGSSGGLINVKYGHGQRLKRIRIQEAGHPLPDEKGLAGAREMVRMLEISAKETWSSFSSPGAARRFFPTRLTGSPWRKSRRPRICSCAAGPRFRRSTPCGSTSPVIKGGGLARIAYPATLVALILSDVIGDPLDAIASGPTVPDPTTFEDCARILNRYELWDKDPPIRSRTYPRGAGRKEGGDARRKETRLLKRSTT